MQGMVRVQMGTASHSINQPELRLQCFWRHRRKTTLRYKKYVLSGKWFWILVIATFTGDGDSLLNEENDGDMSKDGNDAGASEEEQDPQTDQRKGRKRSRKGTGFHLRPLLYCRLTSFQTRHALMATILWKDMITILTFKIFSWWCKMFFAFPLQ